jgi:four helix bundle protein
MFAFEGLEARRHCHTLTLALYRTTQDWPRAELCGLTSQVRRAAVSVEANIAEGVAKRGQTEFRRYLDISLGSLSELACLLRIAIDLGYLTQTEVERIEPLRASATRVTWRLYQAASRRAKA